MSDVAIAAPPRPPVSLLTKIAGRFGVDPGKLMNTLKATAFKGPNPVSDEQMMALLIVADQYSLNPFTKEIFAFPDKGGIVPVVSVDGWARIINEHPQFDGVEFLQGFDETEGAYCTCTMYRKDRTHPTVITEYMSECKRGTQPWNSHPRRMLRHKSLIQCARIAFGFAGIYDEDEAQRIVQMGAIDEVRKHEPRSSSADAVRAAMPTVETVEARPDPDDAESSGATVWTVDQFAADLAACTDSEVAGLIVDEARSALPEEDAEQVAALYRAKFGAGV